MKRWILGRDKATWTPTVTCPYCDMTFSAAIVNFTSKCPFCMKKLKAPKAPEEVEENGCEKM